MMSLMGERLADTLRYERRKAKLSQLELAKRSGVGPASVARLESGEITDPRISTLRKLADALGVDARDLLPTGPAEPGTSPDHKA
jgi:transcriptional regulator with XRE-family HTH domain